MNAIYEREIRQADAKLDRNNGKELKCDLLIYACSVPILFCKIIKQKKNKKIVKKSSV